jgi:ketosteroid isomerase-like protein
MTVKTTDRLDLEAFRRAYEEWDIDALLDLYADDVELVQIDRDHPPTLPRVRHGRDVLRGMFEHCAAAGVTPSPTATAPRPR